MLKRGGVFVTHVKPITIVWAEDDQDDCLLAKDACEQCNLPHNLIFVEDGEQLMDYLFNRGKYEDKTSYPRPGLILLDLNMPRKDGREALKEIKQYEEFRRIPIVIMTTSSSEEDIAHAYELGASAYITKPVTFESFVEMMRNLIQYWFELVTLPDRNSMN